MLTHLLCPLTLTVFLRDGLEEVFWFNDEETEAQKGIVMTKIMQ